MTLETHLSLKIGVRKETLNEATSVFINQLDYLYSYQLDYSYCVPVVPIGTLLF